MLDLAVLVGVRRLLPAHHRIIAVRQRQRHGEILASLPDALDLMVVCVEAGLGLGAALQRVGRRDPARRARSSPTSCRSCNQEMQTGVARTDALRNLAERTGVEDLYSLVAMLIQTDRLGTSVAQSLRAHAESMRTAPAPARRADGAQGQHQARRSRWCS